MGENWDRAQPLQNSVSKGNGFSKEYVAHTKVSQGLKRQVIHSVSLPERLVQNSRFSAHNNVKIFNEYNTIKMKWMRRAKKMNELADCSVSKTLNTSNNVAVYN
jgi:hypothetical protein